MVVEFDTWLASLSSKKEVILGSANNGQHCLKAIHFVLRDRGIVDFDLHLSTFLDSASLWSDLDVLVNLSFPDKVKVEFTIVGQDHFLCLLLVDEELSKIKVERLTSDNFLSGFISKDRMMDLVAFTFDIED